MERQEAHRRGDPLESPLPGEDGAPAAAAHSPPRTSGGAGGAGRGRVGSTLSTRWANKLQLKMDPISFEADPVAHWPY